MHEEYGRKEREKKNFNRNLNSRMQSVASGSNNVATWSLNWHASRLSIEIEISWMTTDKAMLIRMSNRTSFDVTMMHYEYEQYAMQCDERQKDEEKEKEKW